jgi:two-component system cell cycle response regulator
LILRGNVAKAKVLLVEDDSLQAGTAKDMLLKNGYEVLWEKDGIGAIKAVKTSRPDIILLDLVLPGLDGYEVCRWLKQDDASKDIPIIMLTVKSDLADKVSGFQIGADDYLPKPYDDLELNARIYAALRTKALQDELRRKNRQLEELLGKVEYLAITDALTGVFNRRRFHDVLSQEFEKAKRYGTPLSLVMVDIDHFKNVNDLYGHQIGDKVLLTVSQILLSNIREVDTLARFGGEEFALIFPSTARQDAVVAADRIRKSVEESTFPGTKGSITVSIGIAGLPDKALADDNGMLRCADFALYRAKQNGRNRTEVMEGQDLTGI